MSHLSLSIERKAAFLAELSRHGIATRAARAASPHTDSPSGCLSTFKDARANDPEFVEAWEEAIDAARSTIEHEIYRLDQVGYDEPVYGSRYKEEVVGTVRRYSDRLLELRARAMLPAYRDAAALNVNKRVTQDIDVGFPPGAHYRRSPSFRDPDGEEPATVRRPCLRCRREFESFGRGTGCAIRAAGS